MDAQDCVLAQTTWQLTVDGKEFPVTVGTSTLHSAFLVEDLTDAGNCITGIIVSKTGRKMGGQAAQVVYETTITEDYAGINENSSIITFESGIAAKIRETWG